ncbi:hypothetical protein EBZ37_06855 [bacterium]|nr:hypothetical protein [bacterium]
MNTRRLFRSLVVLGVLASVVLASCSAPKIRYRKTSLEKIGLLDSKWIIHFTISNPNMIGVPIDSLQYEGFIGDETIAEGTTRGGVLIRGASDSEVNLPVSIPHRAMLTVTRAAQSGADLPYKIRGKVTVLGITIPFENKGVYKIPPEMRQEFRNKKETLKETILRPKQLFKR